MLSVMKIAYIFYRISALRREKSGRAAAVGVGGERAQIATSCVVRRARATSLRSHALLPAIPS